MSAKCDWCGKELKMTDKIIKEGLPTGKYSTKRKFHKIWKYHQKCWKEMRKKIIPPTF
jgi:hypothetical protein